MYFDLNETKVSLNLLETVYVKLIHFFYNDIEFLSDLVINEWYNEKRTKFVNQIDKMNALKKLEPFIKWLQESDEESDEQDDDEDGSDEDDDDDDDN